MEMFLTIFGLSIIVFKLAILLTIVGFFVWVFIRFFGMIFNLFGYGLLLALAIVGFFLTLGVISYLS
jgi:hypothetical protein